MNTNLPNTIEGLSACLRAGQLTLPQAVSRQQHWFREGHDKTQAATDVNQSSHVVVSDDGVCQPLVGVGLAHKDIFMRQGRQPGLGRGVGALDQAAAQASVLTALEKAGALNLGALTMAEDACAATGQTRHLPTPLNPLGAQIAVGGSSSGSAVAVASGMVYASLGTDTAGSVRIPAMTCGVMGLKTTHGLIDRTAMTPLCPSLDSIGVIARSIGDLSAVLKVLAPQLDWDSTTTGTGNVPSAQYWLDRAVVKPAILPVVSRAMRTYADGSLDVADIAAHEARAASWQEVTMTYEIGQTHRARMASGQACAQVQGLGRTGLAMPPSWWQLALAQRQPCLHAFVASAFAHADVLMAPLQIDVLPTVDEVYVGQPGFTPAKLLALHHYCGWVNYLGLPSLSLPVGCDERGLPVSIQLIGKPFAEPQLLALGQQIQTDIHGEQGIMPLLKI
jgi:aspartyl-tRNA(Asn)/glutamyl-tRNA(Gln) amidotransferase subunit A